MRLIKADHDRWLEIPGLPGPTRRPVDIDRAQTSFTHLRSLRIYRFNAASDDAASEINGHAEEDEVFVVVLEGSVDFTATNDGSGELPRTFQLTDPRRRTGDPCAAYLPPHSAYRLVPKTDAEVAYARATPIGGRPAQVFTPRFVADGDGIAVLLEEADYAQKLRLRLVQIDTHQRDDHFTPIPDLEAAYEAVIHMRSKPEEGAATLSTPASETLELESWDTVAIVPGERPEMSLASHVSALILIVLAA